MAKISSRSDHGRRLQYDITVRNSGDAEATHVVLTTTSDNEHLDILDTSTPYATATDASMAWGIGTLLPGLHSMFRIMHG